MNRRGFLASILAAGVAPAAIGSGILMPVRMVETLDSFQLHPDSYQPYRTLFVPDPEVKYHWFKEDRVFLAKKNGYTVVHGASRQLIGLENVTRYVLMEKRRIFSI